MYAYIFDSFLQERKYVNEIAQIENRLVTLGIQGRVEKMTILKNIAEAARTAIKRGATTVVVIGNDESINKVLPAVIGQSVTLGIIPLGPGRQIADVLGLPNGVAACESISRRVIRHLDLGRANNVYFLFSLQAPASVIVDCGDYRISSLDPQGSLVINNFSTERTVGQPDDGKVELTVHASTTSGRWGRRTTSTSSVFSLTSAKLTTLDHAANVLLDQHVTIKTPVALDVAAHKLDVIVGKKLK